MSRESTMFADATGRELFLGDIVRANVAEAFKEFGVHGDWSEYEITKVPGGYAMSYVRSQKGVVLPYGYLSCFMAEFDQDKLPDIKRIMWAQEPIPHPSLTWIDDKTTRDERVQAFEIESKARYEARRAAREAADSAT